MERTQPPARASSLLASLRGSEYRNRERHATDRQMDGHLGPRSTTLGSSPFFVRAKLHACKLAACLRGFLALDRFCVSCTSDPHASSSTVSRWRPHRSTLRSPTPDLAWCQPCLCPQVRRSAATTMRVLSTTTAGTWRPSWGLLRDTSFSMHCRRPNSL